MGRHGHYSIYSIHLWDFCSPPRSDQKDLLYSDVFGLSIFHRGFKVRCPCLSLMIVVVWWIYWIQDLLGFAWHWNKHLTDFSSLTYFGIQFWRVYKYCHCCYTLYVAICFNSCFDFDKFSKIPVSFKGFSKAWVIIHFKFQKPTAM